MTRTTIAVMLSLVMAGPCAGLADERIPGADRRQVTVRLLEYRFEPAQITLKVGEEAELVLVNEGRVMHEFITEAMQALTVDVEVRGVVAETLGVAELEIPPGATVILRFTPEQPGEFLIACRAKAPRDHFKEGMSGKLVVQ